MEFKPTIGLETHVELSTNSKIFCGCRTEYTREANTHCCPICLGLPGTFPLMNEAVIEYAIRASIATNGTITKHTSFDRKNYVYPDLPRAFQISQYDTAISKGGYIELDSGKKIRLNRIHMEEDAGKLVYEKGDLLIDCNRGSTSLLEIVTEADLSSKEEVREYLEKLQQILRYIDVSDCKMQEGRMRCDVNISVSNTEKLGVRAEIKNMASLTFIEKAIDYETARHIEAIKSGEKLIQETRRFNEDTFETESMREKENATDYRYFREPDMREYIIKDELIDSIKSKMPELPNAKIKRFIEEHGLPKESVEQICKFQKIAQYYEEAADGIKNKKMVANFMISVIFSKVSSEVSRETADIGFPASDLNGLLKLLEQGKISQTQAKSTIEKMLDERKSYTEFLTPEDMTGVSDDEIKSVCEAAVKNNLKAVNDYKNGKEKALKSVVGYVMKETKGKADPALAEKLILEIIAK